MDTWQPDQLKRMQVRFPFTPRYCHTSFRSSVEMPPSKTSSSPTLPLIRVAIHLAWIHMLSITLGQPPSTARRSVIPSSLPSPYSAPSHKLDYAMAGKPWAPSSPPAAHLAPGTLPTRPSSAQGLRKSRASARSPKTIHAATSTPLRSSPQPPETVHPDQKSANEAYFASLGQANATRPTDLPPSQGGRYQGFGNAPSPPPSQHPSLSLTSSAAPSLADFQDNPAVALSKGWSLFSAAIAGASRVVNDNVIQPGMERAMDPTLHASVLGYVSEAQRRAQAAGQSVNEWSKTQLGVDVADHVNGIVGAVRDGAGAGPSASGYGSLPLHDEGETSALYDDTNDLFHEYSDTSNTTKPAIGAHTTQTPSGGKAKKDDDWDEWQDF